MKLTYSRDIDAAYLYVRERIGGGKAVRTPEIAPGVIVDFDVRGRVLGIEFLNASRHIPRRTLSKAKQLRSQRLRA